MAIAPNLLTTEEEPDDDFNPEIQGVKKGDEAAKEQSQQPREDSEAKENAEQPAPVDSPKCEEAAEEQFLDSLRGSSDKVGQATVEGQRSLTWSLRQGASKDRDEEEDEQLVYEWHQLEGVQRPSGLAQNFLAWNDHGHIALLPEQRSLEVKFSQSGDEKKQRVLDQQGFEMAAIGGSTLCLAAGAGAEGGSQLVIRPAKRWDKPVFSAPLGSADEVIEAVACSDDFVAAVTSKRCLRLYGISGLPLAVLAVSGRGVALAARGSLLLVVTCSAEVRDSVGEETHEALEYRLIDVQARAERASGWLPLSPNSKLRWIGLSTEFVPMTVDSHGFVRAMLGSGPGTWGPVGGGSGAWVPVLSLREEEAQLGPLWIVYSKQDALMCISAKECDLGVPEAAQDGEPVARFGLGATLREIRWRLPLWVVSSIDYSAEEILREQLLDRHVEEAVAVGLLGEAEASSLTELRGWRRKAFRSFGQLVKGGSIGAALDIARGFLAGDGGAQILQLAKSFAEKAGQHELAEEVGKLTGTVVAQAPVRAAVQRPELQPLFAPGEGDEKVVDAQAPPAQSRAVVDAQTPLTQSRAAVAAQLPASSPLASSPVGVAPAAANAAAATGSNPFAKPRRAASSDGGSRAAPNLLRDALGGPARRPSAGALDGREPPLKAAKTAANGNR